MAKTWAERKKLISNTHILHHFGRDADFPACCKHGAANTIDRITVARGDRRTTSLSSRLTRSAPRMRGQLQKNSSELITELTSSNLFKERV